MGNSNLQYLANNSDNGSLSSSNSKTKGSTALINVTGSHAHQGIGAISSFPVAENNNAAAIQGD